MFLTNLVAYSAQITIVTVVGGGVMALLRNGPSQIRYTFSQLLLLLCLCLPFTQTLHNAASASVEMHFSASADVTAPASSAYIRRVESSELSRLIPAVLIGGIILRVIWIAVGLCRVRRLRRLGEVVPLTADEQELQRSLRTRAEIRYTRSTHSPVTFGVVSPVVLLPSELRSCASEMRRAVVCHELLHIQRKDWAWLLVEEAIQAARWFHPAIWWLISQIQAAREEVVDRLAVSMTGNRRAYMEALLTFSDKNSLTPAPAFGRQRRLFRRIGLISQEAVMSRKHLVLSCAAVVMATALGSWYAVAAFPLQQSTIGPREQEARAITSENPIPPRLDVVRPRYPEALVRSGLQAFITAQIVLDASGRVAETRRVYAGISRASDYSQAQPSPFDGDAANLFWNSVDDAVLRWYYEGPRMAPIAFPVSFRFAPDTDGVELKATPAPFNPAPVWHSGAVAAGDGIAPPRKVKDVRPVYPAEAQNANVQGVVVVEVRIETDGRVSNTRVMRSIPELDEAALEAVSRWEFSPTLDLAGRPVPVLMTVTVQFTLT
jgi:TonB family protein